MVRKLLVASSFLLALALVAIVLPGQAAPASGIPQAPAVHENGLKVFAARLSGMEETPPLTDTTASGKAVFVLSNQISPTIDLNGADVPNTLYWHVAITDIAGVTMAHIHTGKQGEAGPPVIPLFLASEGGVFDPTHPISGSIQITSTEVLSNLVNGNYYVNVHTTRNPGGEIRGQVTPWHLAPREFEARLSGEQEVPPVESNGSGEAHYRLNDTMTELDYTVAITSLFNTTMAHLHLGAPGQVGPPVIPLYLPGDTRPFDPQNPISGTVAIDPQRVLDLMTGGLYTNVHTQQYPAGEIRGQTLPMWRLFVPFSPVTVSAGTANP